MINHRTKKYLGELSFWVASNGNKPLPRPHHLEVKTTILSTNTFNKTKIQWITMEAKKKTNPCGKLRKKITATIFLHLGLEFCALRRSTAESGDRNSEVGGGNATKEVIRLLWKRKMNSYLILTATKSEFQEISYPDDTIDRGIHVFVVRKWELEFLILDDRSH